MQVSPATPPTQLRQQINTNAHLLRSLMVHIVFASCVALAAPGTVCKDRMDADEVFVRVGDALRIAFDGAAADESDAVSVLATHTRAFATLKAIHKDGPRAASLRAASLRPLLANPQHHYQVRFKGKQSTHDASPFNGAFCFLRIDGNSLVLETVLESTNTPEPNTFDALQPDVDLDNALESEESATTLPKKKEKRAKKNSKPRACRNIERFGSCKNMLAGCPFNHDVPQKPAAASSSSNSVPALTPDSASAPAPVLASTPTPTPTPAPAPLQSNPPPTLPPKPTPTTLEIKSRTVHLLSLRSTVITLTLTHLLTTPGTPIPLLTLMRHIRRTFYKKYVLPLAFESTTNHPLPHFNLNILPTDPDYDVTDDTIPNASEAHCEAQNAVPKKDWPALWHNWNTVRGILSKQFFRRLIHEQYAGVKVGVEGTQRVVWMDVVEDNHVREYPWCVVVTVVTVEKGLKVYEKACERVEEVIQSACCLMDVSSAFASDCNEVEEISTAMDDLALDGPAIDGMASGEQFRRVNVNIALAELETRLERTGGELWKRVRKVIAEERAGANKRRNVLRVLYAGVKRDASDSDEDSEEEDEAEDDQEAESAGPVVAVVPGLPENSFAPFGPYFDTLLSKISPPKTIQPNRLKFLSNLQSIISRAFGEGYTAHLFGSSLTTLASPTSDADVTILLTDPTENPVTHPISNMYLLASVLRHHGMQKVFPVATAKVPIVKFYDPVYKLHADVNVGNALGIENSRLIWEYMQCDERVRDLILLVKYWAARRDLNDSAEGGTFSSYALTLMLLSYLQLTHILPSLQSLHHSTTPRTYIVARTNKPFLKSTKSKMDAKSAAATAFSEYKKRLSQPHLPPPPRPTTPPESIHPFSNTSTTGVPHPTTPIPAGMVLWDVSFVSASDPRVSTRKRAFGDRKEYLASLVHTLHGFFHHYAHVHTYTRGGIVSVRCGGITGRKGVHSALLGGGGGKRGGGGGGKEEWVVVVEDPFQLDRNTAGMVKDVKGVKEEFGRAAGALREGCCGGKMGEMVERVFEQYGK
ncbi:hypothetical protein HDU98_009659 [Podochytrium sp. JEL0797]|nr:hypothetical protein HDU98_009659 [Podochytrium sp. JEL0797]